MSLACGILSMQTRLRNLHLILVDFFALAIDLGLLVFVFLAIMSTRHSGRRRPLSNKALWIGGGLSLFLAYAALASLGLLTLDLNISLFGSTTWKLFRGPHGPGTIFGGIPFYFNFLCLVSLLLGVRKFWSKILPGIYNWFTNYTLFDLRRQA